MGKVNDSFVIILALQNVLAVEEMALLVSAAEGGPGLADLSSAGGPDAGGDQ